jgi:2-polyprenyl-3-methyl-5-hydroxy-6-metoxy-1,4-benzoquinol methylase
VWGYELNSDSFNDAEVSYIKSLPQAAPNVDWVWGEMDRVWDELGLDNKQPLTGQPIANFYTHPVWLMNGIFTAIDPDSIRHRCAIAEFIKNQSSEYVADYGGGSGELALRIAEGANIVEVDIIEPFPSSLSLDKVQNEKKINFVKSLDKNKYDVIVAQDVLEHIEDPIALTIEMAEAVKIDGLVIFANCFYPVIKCHLPRTFHLRHTFTMLMQVFGLQFICQIPNAEHSLVFKKKTDLKVSRLRFFEGISKFIGLAINMVLPLIVKVRRIFR